MDEFNKCDKLLFVRQIKNFICQKSKAFGFWYIMYQLCFQNATNEKKNLSDWTSWTVFEILDIFKTYLLKKFQKTRELLSGDFLFRNPLHSKQRFVVNFIFSIFNFTHFFFKSWHSAEKLCCDGCCVLLWIGMIFDRFPFKSNCWLEVILLGLVLVIWCAMFSAEQTKHSLSINQFTPVLLE